MKKVFSIVFALLILISGMHLSFAKHYCGGRVAAVKWSLTGEKASCGMEDTRNTCPIHSGYHSNCCRDEVTFYAVDSNYTPSSFQLQDVIKKILKVFTFPVNLLVRPISIPFITYTSFAPRDKIPTSFVSLANICVFRI